jgi:hypothetical protein
MSDFKGREAGIDDESNRPEVRSDPPRDESEEPTETSPKRPNEEIPIEGASRPGTDEKKPTGEDLDSGNE